MTELFIFIVLPVVGFVIWRNHVQEKRRTNLRQKFVNLVRHTCEDHAEALSMRRAQLITKDAYGLDVMNRWDKERKYFIERVIAPSVDNLRLQSSLRERKYLIGFDPLLLADGYIEQAISNLECGQKQPSNITTTCTPYEFEEYCAKAISKVEGWKAHVTAKSADQGVDVIAEYRGIKIAIQCKLYSQNIGNKAVQEALVGKAFIRAQKALVITNADFTTSAKQLAKMSSVGLLHVKQIECYFSRIKKAIEHKKEAASAA